MEGDPLSQHRSAYGQGTRGEAAMGDTMHLTPSAKSHPNQCFQKMAYTTTKRPVLCYGVISHYQMSYFATLGALAMPELAAIRHL